MKQKSLLLYKHILIVIHHQYQTGLHMIPGSHMLLIIFHVPIML
jgi:hypothetical protein